jgi:hypothetical protein
MGAGVGWVVSYFSLFFNALEQPFVPKKRKKEKKKKRKGLHGIPHKYALTEALPD